MPTREGADSVYDDAKMHTVAPPSRGTTNRKLNEVKIPKILNGFSSWRDSSLQCSGNVNENASKNNFDLDETQTYHYYDFKSEAIRDKPAETCCPDYSEEKMDQDPENSRCYLM